MAASDMHTEAASWLAAACGALLAAAAAAARPPARFIHKPLTLHSRSQPAACRRQLRPGEAPMQAPSAVMAGAGADDVEHVAATFSTTCPSTHSRPPDPPPPAALTMAAGGRFFWNLARKVPMLPCARLSCSSRRIE